MRIPPIVPVLFLAVVAPCQQGATPPAAKPAPAPAANPRPATPVVQFDPSTGWPIGADDAPTPAAPKGETAPRKAANAAAPAAAPADATPAKASGGDATLASGTQLGSPLLDVFQAIGSPGELRKAGGVVAHWRVVVHGPNGEEIGARELVHVADVTVADRDRLEHADGRVLGRHGGQVFAERNGMPMPAAAEPATLELALFGAQLRMPWLFGDATNFAVVGKSLEERGGERLRKVVVERRPPVARDLMGPEAQPKPVDHFELVYDPATGIVRELLHRFADTLQTRRVLLEDWREFEGVRMPCRRVYVDEANRPTTVLELTKVERRRVSDREFRQP